MLFTKKVMGVKGLSDGKGRRGVRKGEQEEDEGIDRVRQGCIMT